MKKSGGRKKSESAEEKLAVLKGGQTILKNSQRNNSYIKTAEEGDRQNRGMDRFQYLMQALSGDMSRLDGTPRMQQARATQAQVGQRISDRSRSIGRLAAQIARKKRNEGKK
jgi:hypothetical protein